MMLRTMKLSLLLCLALCVAVPAWAGGALEPPDDVGNPSGNDYTGYRIVGYIFGVKDDATERTQIQCLNTGGTNASDVAVQFYDDTPGSPPPVADVSMGSVSVGDYDFTLSSSAIGSLGAVGFARIIAQDLSRKRNPALLCSASLQQGVAPFDTIAPLDVVPAPAKKKKKK